MKQFCNDTRPFGFRGSVLCASLGLLAAALLLAGCGGKKEETTKTKLAPKPLPTIPTASSDLAAPPPSGIALPPGSAPMVAAPPPPAPTPTPVANESDDFEHTFQRMNMLLGEYVTEHKRIPKDVNEMVAWKIISKVPPPPAGKRYVIDQSNGRLALK